MATRWLVSATLLVAILALSAPAAQSKKSDPGDTPATQPSSEARWHKIKSGSGDVKVRARQIKFLCTTEHFRITITAKPNTDGVASRFLAALMEETVRDQDGLPKNWKQVQVIAEGEPKKLEPQEFSGGLTRDGKPKWFSVNVSGQKAHYEVIVEDQGTGTAAKEDVE